MLFPDDPTDEDLREAEEQIDRAVSNVLALHPEVPIPPYVWGMRKAGDRALAIFAIVDRALDRRGAVR